MAIGGYQEPEWATAPTPAVSWTLTEIKGGVEVDRHHLNRTTTVLGRAADMVHLPLHHQSISRQHARIAFCRNGIPWLRDLQSAHGTFVNKRRLPAEACGKVESNSNQKGSRGVVLKVGDVLRFGASSRYFVLEGPPPEASAKEKHLQELNKSASQQQQQQQQMSSATEPTEKTESVSWGIDMGDDEVDDNTESKRNSNSNIDLDPSKIPEKYRKQVDKIQALQYKLSNLETEDSRIRRKGELTDGQQKQLDRIAERQAALRKSIQEREERLHDKLHNKNNAPKRKRTPHDTFDHEEEDDFFDRAKTESNETNNLGVKDAESEESLTIKWKKLAGERNHLTSIIHKAQQKVSRIRDELEEMKASGNEEAFFVQNDLQLALESKTKTEGSLAKTNASLDEIEKLLKVVNPKLQCHRKDSYIGQGPPPPKETNKNEASFPMPAARPKMAAPMPMGPPPAVQTKKPEITSMPPPPPSMRDELPAPENKRKRVIGPAAVPASLAASSRAPRTGTLAFLDRPTSIKPTETTESPTNNQKPYIKASADASKMDVWRAPKGQDGSGKTKLNEKFAGRY